MRRKQPFLLLEVLVALAIVSLCLIPLLAPHFKMTKNEMQFVERRQLEQWADKTYAELVVTLYENQKGETSSLTWQMLLKGIEGQCDTPAIIEYPKGKKIALERHYTLRLLKKSLNKEGRACGLLAIDVKFIDPVTMKEKKVPIRYHLCVQKGNILKPKVKAQEEI